MSLQWKLKRLRAMSAGEVLFRVGRAATLGLEVAGVDILRAHRGPLVMEVNASPGLEGIETRSGLNIAGLMIAQIEQQAIPGLRPKTAG